MNGFELKSKFSPKGDQPEAIKGLVGGLRSGKKHQTLWGVTGSGKTFTIANVVKEVQKPTLVIAHNKTLAAQLADEFREVFPDNAVHYFVSYYDYYQPEAYIPSTDTYIEKDSAINDEIEKLRHAATHSLLTRRDVLIVASVSCIYGIGSPEFYQSENFTLRIGEPYPREELLRHLTNQQFERNDIELKRGTFRLKGDTLEIMPAYSDNPVKIEFFGDVVERISELDWLKGDIINRFSEFEVFPAKHFITPADVQREAIKEIKDDLEKQLKQFRSQGKLLEAERLEQRTNYDMEMIEQTGTCSGIENYSRYFDRRQPGEPSTTLLDYFPKDYLMVIDESHMTVPQIGAMYAGDRSRKEKLVEFGFRLPSAMDNRPLRFDEFSKRINQVVYVSATPGQWELTKSRTSNGSGISASLALSEKELGSKGGESRTTANAGVVRQFIRPTGLLDPKIEVRKSAGQINDLIKEVKSTVDRGQRVLVTTLTKRMAEELTEYLTEKLIKVAYIHSDIPTLERSEILHSLRIGEYDVLVGINLLREGLDLPEVSLVAILDADKEGFLRSRTSLIQTIGRAARHVEGKVIMYADAVTESMRVAIHETESRRKLQQKYNEQHGVEPKSVQKTIKPREEKMERELIEVNKAFKSLPKREKQRIVEELSTLMQQAADKLEFERAAELRDQIVRLESLL